MAIFKRLRSLTALKAEVMGLKNEVGGLRQENKDLAAFVSGDIDRNEAASTKYTGNAYKTYPAIIDELAKKYQARAEWGCVQAGNIIDVRAAFIIGEGLTVGPADPKNADGTDVQNALTFARSFLAYNDLDREMIQEFAKEAEIEGCFLGTLDWQKDDEQVSLRYMSRVETKYDIVHPANDYSWYQKASWKDKGGEDKKLEEAEFVYARFGGRVHLPNEPTPKTGKCLTEIESLSKALRDWREINRLFGSPKPHIECENAADVAAMKDSIKSSGENWKTKGLFIHTGKLGFLSPEPASREGIEREIIMLVKVISGATGVPIHFLGLPDELNGRATADNLMSLLTSSTSKERQAWIGAYQQIIEKAAAIWNAQSGKTNIDPKLIKVSIPVVTAETWQRLVDVWLPMRTSREISRQTFLEQVPNLDQGEETARLLAEDTESEARLMDRGGNIDEGGD